MALDLEGARRAIADRVAAPLGLSVEEAAWGIHQSVNESMANAARVHVLERGRDPRGLPVFVFGGAGPVHGFRVARALGAPTLIAPFGAGVMSTVGFLVAPLAFDFVRSWPAPLDTLDWDRAEGLLAEMEREGVDVLVSSGVDARPDHAHPGGRHAVRRTGPRDPRRRGPRAATPPPSGPRSRRSTSGSTDGSDRRASRSRPSPGACSRRARGRPWRWPSRARRAHALKGERQAWHPELGGLTATPVYDRYRLAPGARIEGPAIVEERESTLVIGPGGSGVVDERWNLVVTVA